MTKTTNEFLNRHRGELFWGETPWKVISIAAIEEKPCIERVALQVLVGIGRAFLLIGVGVSRLWIKAAHGVWVIKDNGGDDPNPPIGPGVGVAMIKVQMPPQQYSPSSPTIEVNRPQLSQQDEVQQEEVQQEEVQQEEVQQEEVQQEEVQQEEVQPEEKEQVDPQEQDAVKSPTEAEEQSEPQEQDALESSTEEKVSEGATKTTAENNTPVEKKATTIEKELKAKDKNSHPSYADLGKENPFDTDSDDGGW